MTSYFALIVITLKTFSHLLIIANWHLDGNCFVYIQFLLGPMNTSMYFFIFSASYSVGKFVANSNLDCERRDCLIICFDMYLWIMVFTQT
jgi:hypothetical protein